MTKGRLEAFSDGVIAILITIMMLELKTPQGSTWSALVAHDPSSSQGSVVLVPHNSLPQTSSGKLSRSKAKANYLSGDYDQFDAAVGA